MWRTFVVGTVVALAVARPDVNAQHNILVMLADDLGVDRVGAYQKPPSPARTPNIDAIADQGVLFRNAYSNPSCSPTRATLLTGRFAWHTGVGTALSLSSGPGLSLSLETLPQVLSAAGYQCALAGKWHLGDIALHPLQAGFLHHSGTINSINPPMTYTNFAKMVDGAGVHVQTYATTDTVNDALGFMASLTEPWFIEVAFNAPHKPFHIPPSNLCSTQLPPQIQGNEPLYSKAMIEALDAEVGRLMMAVDLSDTYVIFLSDNGPEAVTVEPPLDPSHAKGTLFETGIHVPLIAAGPGVDQGAECHALVNTTDLFATCSSIAGAPPPVGLDSISIRPYFAHPERPSQRTFVYCETFLPNFDPEQGMDVNSFLRRQQSVRNGRHKLIVAFQPFSLLLDDKDTRLYDLINDPDEQVNLMDEPLGPQAAAAFETLWAHLLEQQPAPFHPILLGLPW